MRVPSGDQAASRSASVPGIGVPAPEPSAFAITSGELVIMLPSKISRWKTSIVPSGDQLGSKSLYVTPGASAISRACDPSAFAIQILELFGSPVSGASYAISLPLEEKAGSTLSLTPLVIGWNALPSGATAKIR